MERVRNWKGRAGEGTGEGDRWVLGAFFGASGVEIAEAELEEVLPDWGRGRIRGGGEGALRRVAARHGLAAANLALGSEGLRRALEEGTCVLVALPGGRGRERARLGIPVSLEGGVVEVRVGDGKTERWEEEAFEAEWGASGGHGMVLYEAARAAKRLPEPREARLALGEYWLGAGEAARAAAAYRAAAEGDGPGDARGALGAGTAAGRAGRWEEASEWFEAAMALEPENARAMNNAAYARVRCGVGLEEALALAEAAVAANPGNPAYLETQAAALLALGGTERASLAAKCLERAWARAVQAGLGTGEQSEILAQLERAWRAAGREDLSSQVRSARERASGGADGTTRGK